MSWYCVYVRSRHEFKVNDRLTNSGIKSFLPKVDKVRKWKDRKKLVTFPLFPGYLFVEFDEDHQLLDDFISVLKTPGVVKFLKNEFGKPKVVPEEDILNIKKLVGSKKDIDPYPYLIEGQMVKIVNGALKGVTGILLKKESIDYLIVTFEILKRSVCVKLDPSDVEKL